MEDAKLEEKRKRMEASRAKLKALLRKREEDKKHPKLSVREAVRRSVPANDPNGRRMAMEIFGELPAEHPDNPYADQIRAMQRDNPE
ncbi:MAG: hypothetical protein OXC25_05990 [Thiotrichales bacterium]|nr:hypothetical protein [Thiotrichales bacterium]MCY4349376.1 hypothetical protein [Thiotrichales bacterium]